MNTMMPPQEANLSDYLKFLNGDKSALPVTCFEGKYYVMENNLNNFLHENDIRSTDIVISGICELCNLNEVKVISDTDKEYPFFDNYNSLLEALNVVKSVVTANDVSKFKKYIDQSYSFVIGRKYDEEKDLDKNIKECDKLLKSISEEKQRVKHGQSNSKAKFTITFIGEIAVKVFMTFILPIVTSGGAGMVPGFISNIFNPSTIQTATTIGTVGGMGIGSVDLFHDLKDLYLSISDYKKLLDEYEKRIKDMKKYYIKEKKNLSRNENERSKFHIGSLSGKSNGFFNTLHVSRRS